MTANTKQLHKHSLPILLLSAGLCIVSVAVIRHAVLASSPGSVAIRLLTERQLSIKPAANGLFHISHYQPTDQAADNVPPAAAPAAASSLSQMTSLGQDAVLDAALAH